jgi:hypothetical protein
MACHWSPGVSGHVVASGGMTGDSCTPTAQPLLQASGRPALGWPLGWRWPVLWDLQMELQKVRRDHSEPSLHPRLASLFWESKEAGPCFYPEGTMSKMVEPLCLRDLVLGYHRDLVPQPCLVQCLEEVTLPAERSKQLLSSSPGRCKLLRQGPRGSRRRAGCGRGDFMGPCHKGTPNFSGWYVCNHWTHKGTWGSWTSRGQVSGMNDDSFQ